MEKKEYNKPNIEVYSIKPNTILAGSVEVKAGSTSEQNAKSINIGFDDDYEEDF